MQVIFLNRQIRSIKLLNYLKVGQKIADMLVDVTKDCSKLVEMINPMYADGEKWYILEGTTIGAPISWWNNRNYILLRLER